MKIEFNKPVKYKGVIYKPKNSFEIDEIDKNELMQCGGVICDEAEENEIKKDKPTKKAKGSGKDT